MARKRLGEILIEAGLIDETALRSALIEQRRYGGPLGRVLVDMKLVLEDDLVASLSKQLAVPLVDLDALDIPQNVLDLVSPATAEAQGIIPFGQPMKFLDLAMSDPTNLTVIDELRVTTRLNVRSYLAGPKAIERALARFYGRGIGPRGAPVGRRTRDTVDLDSAAIGAPAPPPRPPLGLPPDPGSQPITRGPSFADLAALQERVASLEALVRRDEDVLKKLMGILIEKGVATRDEIIARLK